MNDQFYKNASGQKYITKENAMRLSFRWWCWKISKKYGLKKYGDLISNFEFMSCSYFNEQFKIRIEWDNWEGLSIVALDSKSEPLLKLIYFDLLKEE